jgi:hypothetical protein
MFTRARHWSLSWARFIQFTPSHPISLRSVLILSSHLRQGFRTKIFRRFLQLPCVLHVPPIPPTTGQCPAWYWEKRKRQLHTWSCTVGACWCGGKDQEVPGSHFTVHSDWGFLVFLSLSTRIPGECLQIGHDPLFRGLYLISHDHLAISFVAVQFRTGPSN